MQTNKDKHSEQARQCLIEAAGRSSQDLGLGRIIGQVMAAVYLNAKPSSLDAISEQLGLSKASVSIASRQLDKIGLIERVWVQGDRRLYYKTTQHVAAALQRSVFDMLRTKLRNAGDILNQAEHYIANEESEDSQFLKQQIERARHMRNRADKLINNPLMRLITR